MQKSSISRKNNSTHSTFYHTMHQSGRTTGQDSQGRPKTANLVYASKPYKKQAVKWHQSTSTWRHSSRKYSFSKDQRFKTALPYSLDILEPDIKVPKTAKAASFGKGRRTPIPEFILRNAKEKPGSDAYSTKTFDEMTRSPSKGQTFASSWNEQEKRYISYRKDVYSSHFVTENPPAKYDVRDSPGKRTRAFTAYGRQKMFTQKMSDSMCDIPGPHYSINDRHLYLTIGATNCSFTDADRLDLSAPANDYPGSQYMIPGFCDKFKTSRRKNCPD